MSEIIKVSVIEAEKSSYKIELTRATSGYLYITINQTTFSYIDDAKVTKVRIRAANLDNVIQTLIEFRDEVSIQKPERRIFNSIKKQAIIDRFYKMIDIESLAIQFGCSFNDIAQVLIDENIPLNSNQLPGEKPTKMHWRRKRRRSG